MTTTSTETPATPLQAPAGLNLLATESEAGSCCGGSSCSTS